MRALPAVLLLVVMLVLVIAMMVVVLTVVVVVVVGREFGESPQCFSNLEATGGANLGGVRGCTSAP